LTESCQKRCGQLSRVVQGACCAGADMVRRHFRSWRKLTPTQHSPARPHRIGSRARPGQVFLAIPRRWRHEQNSAKSQSNCCGRSPPLATRPRSDAHGETQPGGFSTGRLERIPLEPIPGIDALYDIGAPIALIWYRFTFFRDARRMKSAPHLRPSRQQIARDDR
jgi:hypothetical protein